MTDWDQLSRLERGLLTGNAAIEVIATLGGETNRQRARIRRSIYTGLATAGLTAATVSYEAILGVSALARSIHDKVSNLRGADTRIEDTRDPKRLKTGKESKLFELGFKPKKNVKPLALDNEVIIENDGKMTGRRKKDSDDMEDIEEDKVAFGPENFIGPRLLGGQIGTPMMKIGQQTPVMMPPHIETLPFKTTHTMYHDCDYQFLIKAKDATSFRKFLIRPTSMYDPAAGLVTQTYAATPNNGVSFQSSSNVTLDLGFDSTGSTQPIPSWRPYMEQVYSKYAVIACDYSVKFFLNAEDSGTSFQIFETWLGDNLSNPLTNRSDYLNHRDSTIKLLNTNRGNNKGSFSVCEFNGTYHPGDFGEDLITTALSERWATAGVGGTGSNPAYDEYIEFAVIGSEGLAKAAANILVDVSLRYTTQWKGMLNKFVFPTAGSAIWNATYPDMYGKFP